MNIIERVYSGRRLGRGGGRGERGRPSCEWYARRYKRDPYKFALKDFCPLSFIFSAALSQFLMNNAVHANTLVYTNDV